MPITIPNKVIQATQWTPDQFKREIAVLLFKEEKLTLAQAAKLAAMHRIDFQSLLATRQIPVHYGLKEVDQDMSTLQAWSQSA